LKRSAASKMTAWAARGITSGRAWGRACATERAKRALGGRRVWVDAQLPPVLARWLARDYGVDAQHVNEIGFLGEDDAVVFAAARGGSAAVVITKDDDFVRLLERHGPPPQVVWVTCGTCATSPCVRS
jgi:predicted nuclease of predicted toxin-antitoxin system